MGSGGRRAAERRVGDEEMEEENNRILVVKSDEKWMKFRKEAVIASLILELMWCFLLKPPVVFAIVSPPMIGLVYSLFSWIRNDGSNACKAFITLVLDTFNNSSRFTAIVFPVKLSLFTLA